MILFTMHFVTRASLLDNHGDLEVSFQPLLMEVMLHRILILQ